ncbi:hypothetical protein [Candidatus Tokpelaia sp.]|uniref:hypothetical protein n=1 Tax=Candidatus Tokpelaia sp. TaxID=2233777 RepID=UPI0016805ADE|nr:hypothetical protein [Candidatus Tokpelaia sp.]
MPIATVKNDMREERANIKRTADAIAAYGTAWPDEQTAMVPAAAPVNGRSLWLV